MRSLARELFQTETSAVLHCKREAKRLQRTRAAAPLHAISQHAEDVLSALPDLMGPRGLPISAGGAAVGAMFSEARDLLFDRLIRRERSYRGTMLGVRHGVDLVHLIEHLAEQASDSELCAFCRRWLEVRAPLVERLERELCWFAEHPRSALQFSRVL
jgi:hypothetical protein